MNKFLDDSSYTINHLQLILSYPAMIVPSLSEEQIQTRIIEAIDIYLKEEIAFEILFNIMENIQLFMGMRTKKNIKIFEAITKINELSPYIKNQKYESDILKVTLNEIFENLVNKTDKGDLKWN